MTKTENKIYYLSSCSTSKKILSKIKSLNEFQLQDIKLNPLTAVDIDRMHDALGTYEIFFSKKSQLYRKLKLNEIALKEADYRKYLLSDYTFLRRPVAFFNGKYYLISLQKELDRMNADLDRK
ncbi:MAG: arsenate reductase [Saprospiraceae bacterium]|nr:arsenate reductase [Saprospiraceae bacterium]